MFAIQTAIKYTEKNIGRYFFLGAFVLVMAVTSAIVYRIGNAGLSNITVIDTIELMYDININENNEISIYKLTVAGYLKTGEAYTKRIPPVVLQSFDLITYGTIESIENIVLSIHINGDTETVKYDLIYAVLEKVDIDRKDSVVGKDVEDALSVSLGTAPRTIREMLGKGFIKTIGQGKNTRY